MASEAIKRQISEADAKRVADFQDYITSGCEPENLRRALTNIYIKLTRAMVRDQSATMINNETDTELYHLSMLIEILDHAQL